MSQQSRRCVCGARGRRHCPALDGMICTRCCGAKRGSELACPAECPHFPFGVAAYDLWLKVDGSWMPKASKYAADHLGTGTLKTMMVEDAAGDEGEGSEVFMAAFALAVHRALFFLPDAEGKTLADLWEQEGWRGLNNDERVMMRYRRHSFPTVIEVQRILSEQALECTDLLEDDRQPFVVFDRNTAARAVRFDRLLIWLCHYPHFSRLGPAGVVIPRDLTDEFMDELRLRASEPAAEANTATVKKYLASHFGECCDLVSELSEARRERMLGSIDVRHCICAYDLTAPRSEVQSVLGGKPDFEVDDREPDEADPPGTEYYSWLRRGESKELEKDMPAALRHDDDEHIVGRIGNVKLLPDRLIVETFSRQKHDFARTMVDKYFGGLVAFRDETIVDLARQVAERSEDADEPPARSSLAEDDRGGISPEEEQQVMEMFFADYYRKFLDEPVSMLQGMTPRQAARNPETRPQLVELMKLHLHSIEQQSRSKGISIRIDWVIDELGLTELRP